uniref:Ribosome receptor lysine/proline rich domain-containing protein n=1 Tax=Echeneis naucrates TaxID=173247 RepID=A0A665WVI7_ECHNA
MAVDIYDSQYLFILAPSLVIALMFLFFWLFMKETSYDEVLARQKRDLKLPPSKPDTRKKNEKKKSKKKESATGGGGGVGGESEEDLRDFDMAEGANSSTLEVEEEPALVVTPDLASPTLTPYVPVPSSTEAPAGLRERKKKEKKAAKAAAAASAAAAAAAAAAATAVTPSDGPEVNGSKPVSCRAEPPLAVSKQSSPPSPQVEVQVQVQAAPAPVQAQTPPQVSGRKKERKKQKAEAAEVKAEQAPASVKKDAPIVAETKVMDGATPNVTTVDGGHEGHVLADSAASANHQAAHNDNVPSKGSGKKQKNETDKENTEVKLKELLSGLSSLALSEAEAVSVMALLREKSPNALDAWHKSAARPDPAAQERERLLTTLQEEASIAKDKVKQLSQELQVEKQKTGRVEAMMREQRAAMEKEVGSMQAKTQSSYQEIQTMQIKYQQVREQLESQITRLQQENGILRDAVSSATNQMESKNSAELNKLRSEYASLMKELADNNSKLQQEEHQRKSLEVSYKQNVSQLEDSKRRWEELQNFLHNVNAEREKLQASNQELHNQLLSAETEMNTKNKEIQTLHSSLTEAIVSKERVEQRVMELMEISQHSMPDDSLQAQVQATHVSHMEELQKLLAEKELQRKGLEDSLNAERSSGASRETNMQALHNENISLKAEIQNLQAQISDQKRSVLKWENMKTVEGLLEKGLIEVANKEEELKVFISSEMKRNCQWLQNQNAVSTINTCFTMLCRIQEKDVKLKSTEESLKAAQDASSSREKTIEVIVLSSLRLSEKDKQVSDLQSELAELRDSLELHRKKNNELREKNWSAMEALSATESMLQGKLSKAVKENQTALAASQAECRDVLHRLLPHVPLPNEQAWLHRFERAVAENSTPQCVPASGDSEGLAEKLKEAEETQRILQKDCETYKKVLAETEGILQRLQSSVEQEESRWRVKLEVSQGELREMSQKVAALEQEVERLSDGAEMENLRREKQHLESELERAERESATYVTEVRELKTQLTETLSKLEAEENERQKVAGDLYKAQQSLDLIQGELTKVTDNGDDLIENSSLSSQREEIDRKEKMTAGLDQTVRELQQLLQAISRQLTKGQEEVRLLLLLLPRNKS